MQQLTVLFKKAQTSSFYLWLLNMILKRAVPFNRPHHISVVKITPDTITIRAKITRSNMNHIRGIHACLLATLCEYISGLSLMQHLPADRYRIILKNITMTYHYQAKKDVYAVFGLPGHSVENEILLPLQNTDAVFKEFKVEVHDADQHHICTGLINWQIKSWDRVKTKMNA